MNSIAPSPMSLQDEETENTRFTSSNKKALVQLREDDESRRNQVNISNGIEHTDAVVEVLSRENNNDNIGNDHLIEDKMSQINSLKGEGKENKRNDSENHPKGIQQQRSSQISSIPATRNPNQCKVDSSEEIEEILKYHGDNPNSIEVDGQLDKQDGSKQIELIRNGHNDDFNLKHEKNSDTGIRVNQIPSAIPEDNDQSRIRNHRSNPLQVFSSSQQAQQLQIRQISEQHEQVDNIDLANLDRNNPNNINNGFRVARDESESNSQSHQQAESQEEAEFPQESLNHNNNAPSSHSNQRFNNRIFPLNNRLSINNNNNNIINNNNPQNNNNNGHNINIDPHRISSNVVYPQDQPQIFLGVSAFELEHMVKVLMNLLKLIIFSTPLNIAVIISTIIGLSYLPDSTSSNISNENCDNTRKYFLSVEISILILTIAVLACDGVLFYYLKFREYNKLVGREFDEMKLSLSDLQDLQSLIRAVWKRFQPFGYLQVFLKLGQFAAAIGSFVVKSSVGNTLQADCSSFDHGYIPQKVATMILLANMIAYGAIIVLYGLCYLIFICVQWTEDQSQINKSIKNCRTFKFSDPTQLGKCDCTCIICYNDYVKDEQLAVLPCPAGHIYHQTCVSYWLDINRSCPTCKHQF